MTDKSYKREHLRAPLNTAVLYEFDGEVRVAQAVNLSEGGMLVRNLLLDAKKKCYAGVIGIPQYPLISNLKKLELKSLDPTTLYRKIFRVKFFPTRKIGFNHQQFTGAKFQDPENDLKIIVSVYVKTFTKNIIFLLKNLEGSSGNVDLDYVRDLSFILGYSRELKISDLRQKVLHDYQSLQWL